MTAQSNPVLSITALFQLIYSMIQFLYCSNLGKPEANQKQTPASDQKTGKEDPNHITWIRYCKQRIFVANVKN